MSIPRFRVLEDKSAEGLENQINTLNGYRAVNVSGYPVSNGYYLVALMEYENKKQPEPKI